MSPNKSIIVALVALGCLSMACAVSAQDRDGRLRGRGAFGEIEARYDSLLASAEIRRELDLSAEQDKQIDDVLEQLAQSRPVVNFQELQKLSQEEQRAVFERNGKKVSEAISAAEEKFKAILTADQLIRLNELLLQLQGAAALRRSDIAERLGLTQKQKDRIRRIQESSQPFGGTLSSKSEEERRKIYSELRERNKKLAAEMLAVLSDEQRSKFAAMKGVPFTFPQPQPTN